MTQPDPGPAFGENPAQAQAVATQIGWGVQDLAGSLNRLGLTWRLRPATTSGSGTQNRVNAILGVYDGDTTRSRFFSMIGPVPGGARVWAIFIPPQGNYIVGYQGAGMAETLVAEQLSEDANFASTSFAPSSPAMEGTFVAGPSGLAKLELWARLDVDANQAPGGVAGSFEVRLGGPGGQLAHSPSQGEGLAKYWFDDAPFGETKYGPVVVPNLIPGRLYWLQSQYQITNTSGTFAVDIIEQRAFHTPVLRG